MLQFFFMDIVAMLANLSFEQGKFPTSYKIAFVTSLLKNSGLDVFVVTC